MSLDHELEAARNRIRALVHLWMSIWDRNTDDGAPLLDLLSPEGFTIELVAEKQTITTIAGVQAWFAKFPTIIQQNNHIVESVEVSRASEPGSGKWRAVTRIRCPVITVQGQSGVVTSHHDWDVVDYGGVLPRISRIKVEVVRQF
jgi:hypothetical protein